MTDLQNYFNRLAEEHCDAPRCAPMTRGDKSWHRNKSSFLTGISQAEKAIRLDERAKIHRSISECYISPAKGHFQARKWAAEKAEAELAALLGGEEK